MYSKVNAEFPRFRIVPLARLDRHYLNPVALASMVVDPVPAKSLFFQQWTQTRVNDRRNSFADFAHSCNAGRYITLADVTRPLRSNFDCFRCNSHRSDSSVIGRW